MEQTFTNAEYGIEANIKPSNRPGFEARVDFRDTDTNMIISTHFGSLEYCIRKAKEFVA